MQSWCHLSLRFQADDITLPHPSHFVTLLTDTDFLHELTWPEIYWPQLTPVGRFLPSQLTYIDWTPSEA